VPRFKDKYEALDFLLSKPTTVADAWLWRAVKNDFLARIAAIEGDEKLAADHRGLKMVCMDTYKRELKKQNEKLTNDKTDT